VIRPVSPAEYPAALKVIGDAFGLVVRLPTVHTVVAEDPDGHFLVAERDGAIVGNCGLHPLTLAAQVRRRHVASIGIAVAAEAQGQGVGTALMQALCDYADRWLGLLRLELTVYVDNDRAIALYRKFGLETEGRFRGYAMRNGALVDAFSMARIHPTPPAIAARPTDAGAAGA